MKATKKEKWTLKFPYGVDITGYVRPNGFKPHLAVLCPYCAQGLAPMNAQHWREQAERGRALGAREYQSLRGTSCEACCLPRYRWGVPQDEIDSQGGAR